MKRFVYILFCIVCFSTRFSITNSPIFLSAQTPEWVYQYVHPSISDEWSSALDVDGLGNTYTTGVVSSDDTTGGHITGIGIIKLNTNGEEKWIYFNDTLERFAFGNDITLDFNKIYIAGYSQSVSGNKDLFIVNVDTSGQAQWIFRDTVALEANAVSVSQSHRIYAAGFTYLSSVDIICIKLDSLGNEKWRYVYDGPASSYDEAVCLKIDRNENIYVGGYSTGMGTSTDFTVIKLDSAGNEKWVYRYDGPISLRDEIQAIGLDTLDNIYMTGWSGGIDWDYCVVKLNPSGQEQWIYRYNGQGNIGDLVYDLVVDDSANIYVCGGSMNADTTAFFTVIKLDSAGNEKWCYLNPGPYDNGGGANSITLDGLGGIYVAGGFRNQFYRRQIAIIKLNQSGDTLWSYIHPHVPPSPFHDNTSDIVSDIVGNIYVAGKICVGSWNDDIVVLKFAAQVGAKEVRRKNTVNNNKAASILRGGVDIQSQNSGDLRIYDILGRMVVIRFLSENQKYFFPLSPGVYFITIESGDMLKCKKVVIL